MISRALLLAALLTAALAPAAPAATKNGITPLQPKAGAQVPAGTSPTFKARVRGAGSVWVHVCQSARKDRFGVICNKESIGRAKRGKGGVFTYRPKFFDFPEFWLNSPGTYYWQAHRIADCRGSDCRQEGPVVKFSVG